jgi:hypothetical protein
MMQENISFVDAVKRLLWGILRTGARVWLAQIHPPSGEKGADTA